MESSESENKTAPIPTDFGKMLQIERISMGIKNAKTMAEALGITPSMLSEIENGKKEGYPDISFLIRCRDFFGWNIKETDSKDMKLKKITKTLELFETGLLSPKNVSLDMNYFHNERKQLLAKVITVLLFMPDKTPSYTVLGEKMKYDNQMREVSKRIFELYESLKQLVTINLIINDLPPPPIRQKITRNRKGKSQAQ